MENCHPKKTLTCNRWRRMGNIANRTTAYNMRANTEMSSGNLDASTTDADIAALIESTDVRLERSSVKMMPRALIKEIMTTAAPFSGVNLWTGGAVVRNQRVEDE